MYRENGIDGSVAVDKTLCVRVFLKITQMQGSIESVLATVGASNLQILEFTVRPSLDKAFYFVHLSLEGDGRTQDIGDSLCALPVVKCAELTPEP